MRSDVRVRVLSAGTARASAEVVIAKAPRAETLVRSVLRGLIVFKGWL